MIELPLVSTMIFSPLAISALLMLDPRSRDRKSHAESEKSSTVDSFIVFMALLSSLLSLAVSLYAAYHIDKINFTEYFEIAKTIGLNYHVGLDGLAVIFVILTNLLNLSSILISVATIKTRLKEYIILFMLLQSLSIGFFCAQNLLLFYFFFEAILIPMYIIIGVWGGSNRVYASIKFFLYTFAGSVFFLLALIFIYKFTGTFEMEKLAIELPKLSESIQKWLWLATFIAFAIKIPMIPFHTWLPDAHVQAPTAGSVMLAGILLKVGGYGMIKVSLPMFPVAAHYFAEGVVSLSVVAIIYGSLVAMAQLDMKKMIAYSSVAHMGYVTAGIFSFTEIGMQGAIFQMISHGLVSGGLFLVVGALYERHHTKEIAAYGGWAAKMPLLATIFMIYMLASVALPGTSGFIGEFFILVGVFEVHPMLAIGAASGVVLGAVYMLKLYRDVMLGEVKEDKNEIFWDLTENELIALVPLVIAIIAIGIYPKLVMQFVGL